MQSLNRDNQAKLSFYATFGLALILCSKFYYLFGIEKANQPMAPVAIILLRDIICLGFLVCFGWVTRKSFFQTRLLWGLFLSGVIFSLIQLLVAKDLVTWSQHYLRNILIPLLFYPVFRGLFQQRIEISVRPVLIWLFGINIFLSYAQIFFSKGFIRPTGLFGDPIINSVFLFWGFIALALSRGKISILLASILLIPLIQFLSSLSALLSVILGALTVFLISKKHWLRDLKKNLKHVMALVIGGLCLITFLTWITQVTHQQNSDEEASEKAQALFNSVFCKQEGCQHWSYRGRIESNLRPYRLCRENIASCFLGNIQTPNYEKVESTWGSLVANWGVIFCFLYLFWIFIHLLKAKKVLVTTSEFDSDLTFWLLVFFSVFFLSIFNTIPYKYPINIMWYASMAFLTCRYESDRGLVHKPHFL
jgi:hypothetical protein